MLVPTTNFVLHWITGRTEQHHYDETLKSIELITCDAYEPMLPLSVVVHIDYEKAPSVIQRFGDVKQLITQTLDPLLSAYFRDVAHKKSMLQLIHDRDEIQQQAREELRKKFLQFDIECVDVLIGRPESKEGDSKIETLLEQLRQRQFAIEQVETFQKRQDAAVREKALNEATAQAQLQAELTKSQVQIKISENSGDAELAKARKQAETTVVQAEAAAKQAKLQGEGEAARLLVVAEAQAKQSALIGEGEGKKAALIGEGEGKRVLAIGNAEAAGSATQDRVLPRSETVRHRHRCRSSAPKPTTAGPVPVGQLRRRGQRPKSQHAKCAVEHSDGGKVGRGSRG